MPQDEENKKGALRKTGSTVFMGEREAGMDELAAMQEPLLLERQKQKSQENYLENVRLKATERAREILVNAYAEREKLLEESRRQAQEHILELERDARSLKDAAQAEYDKAAREREEADALLREAGESRDCAHAEGFQAGMDQAEEELRQFRTNLAASLGALLRTLDARRVALNEFWRDDLAELVRVAAAAGTGWLLKTEHENILRSLVLNALDALEERATLTLRVHPEDEAGISDLFNAARERAPDIRQWIVNADAGLERGDFTIDSAHGSVESRRRYFRDMVDGILENLALPGGRDGLDRAPAGEDIHDLVEREVAAITALAPPLHEEPTPARAAPAIETPPETAASAPDGPSEGPVEGPADGPQSPTDQNMSQASASKTAPEATAETPPAPSIDGEPADDGALSAVLPIDEEPVGDGVLPAASADNADAASPGNQPASRLEEGTDANSSPSIAELEDELFAPEDPSSNPVFSEGGFLPGKGGS